jgi:probable rRNA maturation factor
MPIHFAEQNVISGLKNRRALKYFLENQTFAETQKKFWLTYVFVDDATLLVMNQTHLQHDTLTDIITFDLSENAEEIIGEIYISVDRVKENAAKFKVSYSNELHRVIFHGALHLCGYKDKNKKDKEQMRAMENEWLAAYFG